MSGPAAGGPATIPTGPTGADFVRAAVKRDVDAGRYGGRVQTRFPPEPSGYLHVGHVKAICVNFGIAAEFGGTCALRYDDTNPEREETRYVEQIKTDIHWLGFDWGPREYYASDYFERLYELAVQLIEADKAYVDDLSAEEIIAYRGVAQAAGRDSPYRTRSVAENLDLFRRMRAGEFEEGACVLRAKIDMAAPNVYLRDPVMYRIMRTAHHRTGGRWRIYPTYDWAHGQSDSIEGVTHSLCTLEYEPHRPLYDWFIAALGIFPSRQIEYNHLYLSHTMTGKRRLKEMVEAGHVTGWDDPRLPTIAALRRRGVPPAALRRFATAVGLSKTHVLVQIERFEHLLREHLNRTARRVMAVLDPIRLIITNYPAGQVELVECDNNPEDPSAGTRQVPFSGELYVERGDFRDDPPRKWFRLAVGREVRLKHACYVTCDEVVRDAQGPPHRAALHLRPRFARGRHRRRPQGARHPALGLRRARAGRRGAPVRPAVHQGRHERPGRGRRLARPPQPGRPARAHRLQAGAGIGRRGAVRAGAVHPHRLLLPGRARRGARAAGLQPHHRPARYLGQDRAGARRNRWHDLSRGATRS